MPDKLTTATTSDGSEDNLPAAAGTLTTDPALSPGSSVPTPTENVASSVASEPSALPSGTSAAPSSETPVSPGDGSSASSGDSSGASPTSSPRITSAPNTSDEGPSVAGPVAEHGQLKVTGSQIQDATGQAVILRGQGFAWDNWWPQYYNADVVSWLRDDWCVDVVRPAMGIEPDGAYLMNPEASRARIKTIVEAAIAKGIYVIIDWHSHNRFEADAVAFFADMAQTYGQYPNVIYEVYNEPEEETWPEVKAYAEAVGAAIRRHDPDNLIIVGCPEWDQRIDLVAADPITSLSNVVYAVHFYAATHGAWLRDRTGAAIADGIPVIVSESSGSEASGMGANDYTEWQEWFDFMDANGISWLNYSVSDKEETISVLEPGAPATAGWDASQLTETGEYIRNVFRGYCE